MVWELAVACPIPYDDAGPFDWDKIEVDPESKEQLIHVQQSLREYQFEVVIDGLSLRKPKSVSTCPPLNYRRRNEQLESYFLSMKI